MLRLESMLVLFVLSKALEWSEVYRATSVAIYRGGFLPYF